MDIAKYIGLFLLKNNFVYIHGLGNLELKKKAAQHDGQSLQAPQYEVALTPGGSIDDSLANYIATHEQTSISKAANALREFSIQSRADLHAGKEVPIPSIGKFVETAGLIRFVTEPNMQYTPPSIPALRNAKRVEDEKARTTINDRPITETVDDYPETGGSGIAWGKVALLLAILLVLGAGGYFGYRYYQEQQQAPAPKRDSVATTPPQAPAMTAPAATTAPMPGTDSNGAATAGAPANLNTYKALLNTYPTLAAAQRRQRMMADNGFNLEIVTVDSSHYQTLLPITAAPADTARILDSLTRMYGSPKRRVSIYRN